MHLHHSAHEHDHAGSHLQPDVRLNWSFALAVVLNVLLVAGEALAGFVSGSMALLADAGHNLSDVAGLLLAWCAHWLRGKGAGEKWTYGLRAFTMVAANLNGVLIVVAIVGVSIESVRRLFDPSEVAELPVLLVALLATVLNFGTAKLLSHGNDDLNVRGAYLHMLADAAVSLAVCVGAVVMMLTSWTWVDPAISLGICLVLAFGTWQLLKESTSMMMHGVPLGVDLADIRQQLCGQAEVAEVADLHVWSVSTTDRLLSARLLCPELLAEKQDELLVKIHRDLSREYGIAHATIEIIRQRDVLRDCELQP